jgi:L,D-transpeptidase ErfK/SrfK
MTQCIGFEVPARATGGSEPIAGTSLAEKSAEMPAVRRLLAAAFTSILLTAPVADSRRADGAIVGGRLVHTVVRGESLTSIGARYGIDPRALAALNGMPFEVRLQVGHSLIVDNRHVVPDAGTADIVINLPQRMLFHFAAGSVDAAYPVGLGRPSWPTFIGEFKVAILEREPVWDVPPSIQAELERAGKPVVTRVPPGPQNPLGAFWIGLDRPGFGIHGTNAPASIYHFQTHGCIRVHPDDVADLFTRLAIGAAGRIVYEPVLLARTSAADILLEVHPDIYRKVTSLPALVREVASRRGLTELIDWEKAAAVVRARNGVPMNVAREPATDDDPAVLLYPSFGSASRSSAALSTAPSSPAASSRCQSIGPGS